MHIKSSSGYFLAVFTGTVIKIDPKKEHLSDLVKSLGTAGAWLNNIICILLPR